MAAFRLPLTPIAHAVAGDPGVEVFAGVEALAEQTIALIKEDAHEATKRVSDAMGGGGVGQSLFVPMPPEGIRLIQALYRTPNMENLQRMLDVFVYDPKTLTPQLLQGRFDNMMRHREHLENFCTSMEVNPRQVPDLSGRLGEILKGRDS